MDHSDRNLGMHRRITRRDFIDGMIASAAGAFFLPSWLSALEAGDSDYPPALTGLRGSNDGSFETAHLLRDGSFWKNFSTPDVTRQHYDLVIVGAGISGLAAAWFYRKTAGPNAKILILDNHDDFGGHARRQEFRVGNRLLLTFGGTYAIDSPAPYSQVSHDLIAELGINVSSWKEVSKASHYRSLGLKQKFFFDRDNFPSAKLVTDPFDEEEESEDSKRAWETFLEEAPISDRVKRDLIKVHLGQIDFLPGLTAKQKKAKLTTISYADFLTKIAGCDPGVLPMYQTRPHELYGAGIDAVSALDAWGLGYDGFQGMALDSEPEPGMNRDAIPNLEAKSYFFHFPDGGATIARLLLQRLIPDALPAFNASETVTTRTKYSKLDLQKSPVRIRLSSTVVRVAHTDAQQSGVEIAYVRAGKLQSVTATRCILACWHSMIPYICPELPDPQKVALAYGVKVPLLQARVALRNWTSLARAKARSVYAPGSYYASVYLSPAVHIGSYQTATDPEQPIVIALSRTPCRPGLPVRNQHRIGRGEMLRTTFEDYERHLRRQLAEMFGPYGFDPGRDIKAISVFRWPHGYAYQYNSLFDPFWLKGEEGPCALARKPYGRIAIANSDAGAYAYIDSAIDQAHRATREVLR